jgi:predicted GNAT family N-acyltransferase
MSILGKLESVHVAQTPSEFHEVYRLRYQVYVNELQKGFLKNIDHKNRYIKDPEDERPESVVMYTVTDGMVSGTMRLDAYTAATASQEILNRFNIKALNLDHDQVFTESCRLIISEKYRGGHILPALARKAYQLNTQIFKAIYSFQYGNAGLVDYYRKLGFRPYAAELIHNEDGIRIPMINVVNDVGYYEISNSPLSGLVRDFHNENPQDNTSAIKHLLKENHRFVMDRNEVWSNVERHLTGTVNTTFIKQLSQEALKELTNIGVILKVKPRRKLIREQLIEQELFVVLDGIFELTKGNYTTRLVHQGDVFGELAMFLDSKVRTNDAYSITSGELLVIKAKALQRLIQQKPTIGNQILVALCRSFAYQLALH